MKQIVLGSHLKPLKREETDALRNDSMKGHVVWNTLAGNGKQGEFGEMPGGSKSENVQLDLELPESITEFCVMWKKCTDCDSKIRFLKYVLDAKLCGQEGSSVLKNVFAEEVPPEILPQILEVFITIMNAKPDMSGIQFILKILQIIGESKKFDLTRAFLSKNELNILQELFEKLEEKMEHNLEVEENKSNDFQGTKPVDLLDIIKSRYDFNKIM